MTMRAVIVFALLAAIVIPILMAEARRFRPARTRKPAAPRTPRTPAAAARPPLRLVVDKDDMDRELAALLAKDARKRDERDQ